VEYTSTILIVDDEPSARKTLQGILFREGYDLFFANNGEEGLAKAAELTPDLILLDVMMPGMDGFEVCRRLRADPLLAEVPVIMVTALDDRDSRLQGIKAGADDFVSKPFDVAELRARVQTITRLNRYRRLLAERARFEWVIEQADDGYLMVNDRDEVLYANSKARLYLGLPTGTSEPVSGTFQVLSQKQYHLQSPHHLVRPESPTADALWLRVDLMEMTPGAFEGYLVRLRDVTASVIGQRLMWTFQAHVRHKLRTPLAHLISSFDLLERLEERRETLPDEEWKSIISTASRSVMRLEGEIQGIFRYMEAPDMSRPGQGRFPLAEIAVVANEISAGLKLKPVNISSEGFESLADIYVAISPQAMGVILEELLENARKFHPEQSPVLEIKMAETHEGVRIQVRDDGLTLSPDQLAKMWTPYYQAEKDFSGEVPGMGLGLSMVASLVYGVGGACRAYNREGGPGVVVELVLPLAKGERDGEV
jgi:two-component system cell cycle response regulator